MDRHPLPAATERSGLSPHCVALEPHQRVRGHGPRRCGRNEAALDVRIETLANAADTVAGVNTALADVQAALEQKPAQLGKQFEAQLGGPAAAALAKLQALENRLRRLRALSSPRNTGRSSPRCSSASRWACWRR